MSRVLCAILLLTLASCSFIHAQDVPKPKNALSLDIFGGFSYANYELISIATDATSGSTSGFGTGSVSTFSPQAESARLGLYGWNGAISANVDSWFSFVTDFSGIYSGGSTSITQTITLSDCGAGTCTETIQTTVKSPKIHNFLFGPQFEYPHGRVRPLARFLVGGSRRSVTTSENITENDSPFTFTSALLSSSADNEFAMAFGGGADYRIRPKLAWRMTVDYLTGQGTGQNNVRISSGILWHFGN